MELIETGDILAKEALEQAEREYHQRRQSHQLANRMAREAQLMGEGETLQSAQSAVEEVMRAELSEMRRKQANFAAK